MNKKICGGFSPLIIIVGIFVLLSLGTGVYIIKRNPAATPIPLVNILPTPALTSAPTPTSVAAKCVIGGCSGELCIPEDQGGLASICIIESHYICYKKARCEVQQNGACGWTQTPEFAACITKAKATPAPIPSLASCNPPIQCAPPPPGCNYQGSSTCACGKLTCLTPVPTPVPTPISAPTFTPTPLPLATSLPTPPPYAQSTYYSQSTYTPTPIPSLIAGVRDDYTIDLKQNGTLVTQLPAGTYSIQVLDQTPDHNFRLTGPGVDRASTVPGITPETWTVTFTQGTYTYVCDPHSTIMRNTFTVTGTPSPTPTTPS